MNEKIISSNNTFALDLYSQLKNSNENVFISPFSIFTAITMVYVGARGTTENEIKITLHLTLQQRRLPLEIKNLVDKLTSVENTEINIANSIWADLSYELLENFLYIIEENYNGALYKENFNNIPEICAKINAWVKDKTKEKISEIISPDSFTSGVSLILLNAIYFNGVWEKEFKEDLTNDAPFYLLSGKMDPVPLMHQEDDFSYLETDTLQILSLSYKGMQRFGVLEQYKMMIFLPKERDGLEKMENSLTLEKIYSYEEQLYESKVKIYIPKFKIKAKYELKDYLKAMGMNSPFNPGADFSGIVDPSKNQTPYIGEIIHKTFIDVNEKGTEAAAVTMITMLPKGFPIKKEISIFKADHPFLFMIQDSQTKTILFIGRILNPNA